eukprot:7062538-Pyramimonas_sp.AAC.1
MGRVGTRQSVWSARAGSSDDLAAIHPRPTAGHAPAAASNELDLVAPRVRDHKTDPEDLGTDHIKKIRERQMVQDTPR